MLRTAFAVLLVAACPALPARAFPIFGSPGTTPVVEYYNTILEHYFLTANAQEMYDIEHGSAGPGWTRTGWFFNAYDVGETGRGYAPGCVPNCGTVVARFYGTPGLGPNSHFYTADATEAAGLEKPGSGWTFERNEFQVPVPSAADGAGQCASGLTPVYRLYNNGFARHVDGNHRYVTDAGERAKMQAKGWIDEGVRFCAYTAGWAPITIFTLQLEPGALPGKVMSSARCEDESVNLGSCVAINNLPVPTVTNVYGQIPQPQVLPNTVYERTGVNSVAEMVTMGGSDPWSGAYVGASFDHTLALHVGTRDKGPANLSSVNPLFQLTTTAPALGQRDQRFFPWAWGDAAPELNIQFSLFVKTIEVHSAGGAAYGHPTLEFIDTVSGHHLYFTVLAYTSQAIDANDYLALDASTGKVIVGTDFRPQTRYGRSLGLSTLPTPSGFVSPNAWGWGGYFAFRMNHAGFQNVIDDARRLDPALSANPAAYLLDNFHFNNEVAGDGEIGLNLSGFRIDVLPPPLP